jgi:hypothetical protein
MGHPVQYRDWEDYRQQGYSISGSQCQSLPATAELNPEAR